MRKFKKRVISVIISIAVTALFSMSQMMTVFAADIAPVNYVFSMVLRACGVSPGEKVGAWQNAYEGYLEKTGNQTLLSQVKGYGSLSWGSTAQGVDDLYWSVREWLSSATVKEFGADSCLYELPSSPAPQIQKPPEPGVTSINTTPFSHLAPLSGADAGDYEYLFSDVTASTWSPNDNPSVLYPAYFQRNVYAPKEIELFGVVMQYNSYDDKVIVEYFTPDASSSKGYRSVSVKSVFTCYKFSNGDIVKSPNNISTWNWNRSVFRSVMNYPFKIFATAKAAENYCKTGTVSNLFTLDSMTLSSGGIKQGADLELINVKVDSVSSSMSLPANAAAASAALSSIQAPMDLGSLSKALASAGMEVAYTASYKIEHYKQDVSDPDKPVSWIKESEESLSGVVGQEASFKPKSYPNFLYAPELTDPQDGRILGDGSLVIRLYYKPDPDATLPYTVEYHKDGEVFETISGTVPMFGDRIVRACEDLCPQYYLLDTKASTPLPFEVTEQNNTIQIYYKKDLSAVFPYTIEYHKDGEVFKTLSGFVPVFGEHMIAECKDFCPQYYLPDTKASTPLPYEVTEDKNTIRIYYKRDLSAVFPYTVEYYKDGELFKTVPGSVSVFNPSVKSCVSYCPSGYVLDTSSSTPLPCNISADGGVVKQYYVKKDTVISYTVEYYRDGLRKNTFSGNVPAASPVVESCPSYCPEYYKLDTEHSDSFPYTLTGDTSRNRIRIYYKKDEEAVFPYTVECYKDGKLVETASKTVSVFHPTVKEYGFDCPEGYVVDTSSSTVLPYSVSKEGNVIKYYYVDEGRTLPYTVEYHKDGKVQMTLTGNVPVTSPEVKQYWPYSPNGYLLDEEASDALPFTVTKENNVIHAYYIPDPSDPYASFVSGVKTMMNSIVDFFKAAIWWLIFLVILVIFCDRNMVIFKRLTSHAWKKEPKQKKKVFTAPKSKFMKGVHANKGSSLRSKANMQKGIRPGSLKSKATISDRRWKGGYSRRR